MERASQATAFAPASIGNVGVGFDMLGLAISGAGDRVAASRRDGNGVRIAEVRGPDGGVHPGLSADASENTAGVAAMALWDAHGDGGGLTLSVEKGIPLKSGMGSSAASAVAAAMAVNRLLEDPLPIADLLDYALQGEQVASRAVHADNVAPSLFGGLVLCPAVLLPATVRIATPDGLCSVLLHPELEVSTAESRKALAQSYSMEQWLTQQGLLAGFIAGMQQGDVELVRSTLKDTLIEPQRASAVPGFTAVKAAAIEAGALGASLSGSGPSIFAICRDSDGEAVAAAMSAACRDGDIECGVWTSPLDAPGAVIESWS